MRRGNSGFERLLHGLIMVTGFYIIYRGSGILAESGWLRRLLSSPETVQVLQQAAGDLYLPGIQMTEDADTNVEPHLSGQFSGSIWMDRWMESLLPLLHSWEIQALKQEELETKSAREVLASEETESEQGRTKREETESEQGMAEGEKRESEQGMEEGKETESEQGMAEGEETESEQGMTEGEETESEQGMAEGEETESEQGMAEGEETEWNEVLAGALDFNDLIARYYVVDADTTVDDTLLDAGKLLSKDLSLEKQDVPQILIYHTHSQEGFLDSVPGDLETGIVGAGSYLAGLLEDRYGYQVIHDTGVYDLVDGVLDRSKAYDYARTSVEQILEEYPSIEVIIDLHRDGVEGHHFVVEENGKQTAKIMFFNGLSQNSDGQAVPYLANPYIEDNLAFSLQLQLAAQDSYPGFTRNIYLKGQRFNLHLRPRSLLIEAGTQLNTREEEKNAMEPLADILNQVLSGQDR